MFSWPVRAVVVTMPWLVAGGMVGAVRVVRRIGALEVADEGGEDREAGEDGEKVGQFFHREGLFGFDWVGR